MKKDILNSLIYAINGNCFGSDINYFLLEDLFLNCLKSSGIIDLSFTSYDKSNAPDYILEVADENIIVFSNETVIDDDTGVENNKNYCIIQNKKEILVFSSKMQLSGLHEFKIYKKYFIAANSDRSLIHIPATLLFLEFFADDFSQSKVVEIISFLKKIKQYSGDYKLKWMETSGVFMTLILYYAMNIENCFNYKEEICKIVSLILNEKGAMYDFFIDMEKYTLNPTAECREKKSKIKEKEKQEERQEKKNKNNFLYEIIADFFDVLFFWK